MNPFAQDGTEEIKKNLFSNAMKSYWEEVIRIYNEHPEAHYAKITKSGNTTLHMAIAEGQESTVEKLVRILEKKALEVKNELGNTPLHLAAYLGNVRMCRCIATRESKLMGIRNNDNETPFFLAVLHGRKDVFLCLHSLCKEDEGYGYCRGRDGETILHSAISREYFDMAIQIIHFYGKLANSVNEQGISPFHILASKPSAFRSGSHIRGFDKLIYNCIFVDELKLDTSNTPAEDIQYDHENPKYPENYQTCMGMFLLLRNILRALTGHSTQQQDEEYPKVLRKKNLQKADAEGQQPGDDEQALGTTRYKAQGHEFFPANYFTCFHFFKFIAKAMQLVFLGLGNGTQDETQKCNRGSQLISKHLHQTKKGTALEMEKNGTPILIAAKNGIHEMVAGILDHFPAAIHDMNNKRKNIVLLAVEHRQTHLYKFLLDRKIMKETIFRKTDKDGNSALHLAAMLGDYLPWHIPGAALQMQWEIKWYEFVKNSMPLDFFPHYNNKLQTPSDIFSETHHQLATEAGEWLTDTSQSCSVVAALIATVAFATSATVPGGVKSESGTPTLENKPAFSIFAISSLVALCFSVTSVIMFLAILTSRYKEKDIYSTIRYQEKDFGNDLPRKLLVGLTSLFMSIGFMLLSFCSGHFFVLKDKIKYAAIPIYAITCLPVIFFVVTQFPLYFPLVKTTITKMPERSYG